jgi:hypothetical protein
VSFLQTHDTYVYASKKYDSWAVKSINIGAGVGNFYAETLWMCAL